MHQSHPGAGSVGHTVLLVCLLGQVLEEEMGAFQPQLSACDKADVIPCQDHRAQRQHRRFDPIQPGICQGMGRVTECILKVFLDAGTECLQSPPARVPIGLAGLIDALYPLAHGVAVDVHHRDEIVLPGNLVKAGGIVPSGRAGQIEHIFQHPVLLPVMLLHSLRAFDPEASPAEGCLPPRFLFFQRRGEGGQILAGGPCGVILFELDEDLHPAVPAQGRLGDNAGKLLCLFCAAELEHRMPATGIDQVLRLAV